MNRSHKVIKSSFERVQRQNPKFSIRALATKLGISHVFLLKVLKGQAAIPDKKIPALIKALSLDELSQLDLREALVYDAIKEKLDSFPGLSSKKKLIAETYEEYPSKFFSVLDHWYDLAVLDLLTCNIDDKSSLALAKKLGLTTLEIETSLEKSSKLGLARYKNGSWEKTETSIRFPTTTPSDVTRRYYEQVLNKVREELKRASPENYAKRSITNISIAVDPEKIPEAKKKIQQAIYEIVQDLTVGDPKEVYHLTTCLVPVSDRN